MSQVEVYSPQTGKYLGTIDDAAGTVTKTAEWDALDQEKAAERKKKRRRPVQTEQKEETDGE